MLPSKIKKSRKKIIIVRVGLLQRETRVTKIIKTLVDEGYHVTLLNWDQGFKTTRSERCEAGDFHKEISLKLNAQWGTRVYLALPIWWCFVFYKLMTTEWDLVHAVQITSIIPSVVASKLKNKNVIYDLLDVYEDSIFVPEAIRKLLIWLDKIFMRLSTAVVLADECEVQEVGGIPNDNIVAIYDSPSTVKQVCLDYEAKNSVTTFFFAGLLIKKKALNLDKIFKAIECIDGVKIVIAGYGDLVSEIKEWAERMPEKIQFIGEISHSEVLERSAKADGLFLLRDPKLKVNKYICGSKILEAMMCGRPIIVNKGTSTAKIVREEKCGLVVDVNNIDDIRDAILRLMNDKSFRETLGRNGKKAYDLKYSWNIMKKRLIYLYEVIFNI